MNISDNNFSKKVIAKSTNQFTEKTLAAGGSFTGKELAIGTNPWEGQNLTADNPGLDNLEEGGIAPGSGEVGGIAHFRGRIPPPPISHK